MSLRRSPTWSRLLRLTCPFFRSASRWQTYGMLALLLTLVLTINGLNLLNGFVNYHLMNSLENRWVGPFFRLALVYVGVFAASTVVVAFQRFTEERFGLRWREWLTQHLMDLYLAGRVYCRLNTRADVDNPDQRIAEDVKTFTQNTLSLLLIGVNSTVALVSWSGVLWSITPWLFVAAAGYALGGSLMTVLLGRRLIRLDVQQFKKEADFRYDLIQVRTHAEPIALVRGEASERVRLGERLAKLVANMKAMIRLNRNIAFCTEGFNYLIQLIPLLIVAPLYMRHEVRLGDVTMAAMGFSAVMNAFSLVVREFGRISLFGAVVERLGRAWEVIDEETAEAARPAIETDEDAGRVSFERLTLVMPADGKVLVRDLSLAVPRGQGLLVLGPNGPARAALFRATAGLWTAGVGRIVRPPLEEIQFLPQRPYLGRDRLRDQLVYGLRRGAFDDEQLLDVLREVGLEPVLERVGGLDAERDWGQVLSLGEQQLLAGARLLLARPRFAFLEESASALDPEKRERLYGALARAGITYVTVAADPGLLDHHDLHLELDADGTWELAPRAQILSA